MFVNWWEFVVFGVVKKMFSCFFVGVFYDCVVGMGEFWFVNWNVFGMFYYGYLFILLFE